PSKRRGEINYLLVNDLPTLLYLANLAAIELHPLLSRVTAINDPTQIVFDLDPGEPAGFPEAAAVALHLRDLLAGEGLAIHPKSSGSKGLHLALALDASVPFPDAKAFAQSVALRLVQDHPELITANMSKAVRPGKVFIDWSQNSRRKSTVSVY